MTTQTTGGTKHLRAALILLIVALAFVASYQIANAAGSGGRVASDSATSGDAVPAFSGTGTSPACACCGDSGTGETIEGAAVLEGNVQRITVDTSNGYNPNVIKLAAGVPAELTFKQASGCLAEVVSQDLGFYENLTSGDKTITLDAQTLKPGTYEFSCGMQMAFGTVVVE